MRRLVISLILVIFLVSLVSAEGSIFIHEQPSAGQVYNLEEIIPLRTTITPPLNEGGSYAIDLMCNGIKKFIQGGTINRGVSETIAKQIQLSKSFLGELVGDCKIIITFTHSTNFAESLATNDFKISNLMIITVTSTQTEFEPSKEFLIRGNIAKESGKGGTGGFVELQLLDGNTSVLTDSETITNGFFMINTTLPAGIKAGAYSVSLNAYEKDPDSGSTTNSGTATVEVKVKQVPSNLEIVFENSDVEPGTSAKIKTILHDQTGVSIPSTSFVTIKNGDNIIIEQSDKPTDVFYEFPIKYNEKPSNWAVVAISNKLEAISNFTIKEKEAVDMSIINKTIIVKNIGNVIYNKTILVNLGNSSLNINVSLNVDEEKKYELSAPTGEYNVEIKTAEGSSITGLVSLTGKEVSVREYFGGFSEAIRHPSVWITLILILGFVAFLVYRKIRKKSFFGKIFPKRNKKQGQARILNITEESMNAPKNNKAELSLSIKGEKQDATVVCLRIKNLREMKTKEDVRNTLQKIEEMADEQKAVEYESQDMIFFLFVPLRTKTFRNEEDALKVSQAAKEILLDHNRLYKNKVDFGISLHHGDIIAKQDATLKFMSIGTLTTISKRIALLANEDVLMSDKMNERVQRFAKTERRVIDGVPIYSIRELKQRDQYKGFLDNFTRKLQEDKRE
ncbi:MAG: hypothetical protein Q7S06_03585 [Nanoarchaeota archaeon]|nr:hypothetical protein [Nanoarchaeota archaeon]